MRSGFRDWFIEQLAMYAAYHRDRRNQRTHHVGVPLIVFSLLVALSQLPVGMLGGYPVTVATVLLGILLVGYIIALPLVGLFTAMFYGAVYGLVLQVGEMSAGLLWVTAAGGFISGWAIQFIGHAFEGRRPALTVNALQVFMAPPFLIAEILFSMGLESVLEATIQSRSAKYLPADSSG